MGHWFVKIDHFGFKTLDPISHCTFHACRKCNSLTPIIQNEIQKFVENGPLDVKSNMDDARKKERNCSEGDDLHYVKYECNNFRLEKNNESGYNLLYKEDTYPPDSFCFGSHKNEKDLIASMCIRQSRMDRFK